VDSSKRNAHVCAEAQEAAMQNRPNATTNLDPTIILNYLALWISSAVSVCNWEGCSKQKVTSVLAGLDSSIFESSPSMAGLGASGRSFAGEKFEVEIQSLRC
jgi:hypothetical protein